MATLGDKYRYFSVVVNNGSGVLYQPDNCNYTYVLTVKHNLYDERTGNPIFFDEISGNHTIKISRTFEEYRNKKYFNIINHYIHPSYDYAIILIDRVDNPNKYKLTTSDFIYDSKAIISGFPQYMRNDNHQEYRTSLQVTVNIERSLKKERDLILANRADTFNAGAASNIIGFSGSGIFIKNGHSLKLCGVLPKLNDNGATFDKVVGLDLSGFKEIINQNDLAPLKSNTSNISLVHYLVFISIIILGLIIWCYKTQCSEEEVVVRPSKNVDVVEVDASEVDIIPFEKRDTIIEGNIEFYGRPYEKFDLEITPSYSNSKIKENIPSLPIIKSKYFKDTIKIIDSDIKLNLWNKSDKEDKWILFNTGENVIKYTANEKLLFRTKDDYYEVKKREITKDWESGINKIESLTKLTWMEDKIDWWYQVNYEGVRWMLDNDMYFPLFKRCEELVEDSKFYNLTHEKKVNLIIYWRQGFYKLVYKTFKDIEFVNEEDAIFRNIGYAALKVLERNSTVKKELRALITDYNRVFNDSLLINNEKDLIKLLNI